jgi:hypothetical protein
MNRPINRSETTATVTYMSLDRIGDMNNQEKEKEKESDYRVDAMLVGETVDGYLHIRPLCTTADVTLAFFELLDPDIFETAYVMLPHTLNVHYQRWTKGFYRYEYRAKEESKLFYLR